MGFQVALAHIQVSIASANIQVALGQKICLKNDHWQIATRLHHTPQMNALFLSGINRYFLLRPVLLLWRFQCSAHYIGSNRITANPKQCAFATIARNKECITRIGSN